jgi:hypothetical protein
VQKVRLLHGVIRKLVQDAGPAVERKAGTKPLNQMQLLGTLMSFSVLVLDGLRVLGFQLEPEDADAWHYLWQTVGSIIGIEPDNIPPTVADGQRVFQEIRDEYWGASKEGVALAQATLGLMTELLPGDELDGVGATLVRRLAGPRCADLLKIPAADDLTDVIMKAFPVIGRLFGGVMASSPVASGLGQTLQGVAYQAMLSLASLERAGKDVKFTIPSSLKLGWEAQVLQKLRAQ